MRLSHREPRARFTALGPLTSHQLYNEQERKQQQQQQPPPGFQKAGGGRTAAGHRSNRHGRGALTKTFAAASWPITATSSVQASSSGPAVTPAARHTALAFARTSAAGFSAKKIRSGEWLSMPAVPQGDSSDELSDTRQLLANRHWPTGRRWRAMRQRPECQRLEAAPLLFGRARRPDLGSVQRCHLVPSGRRRLEGAVAKEGGMLARAMSLLDFPSVTDSSAESLTHGCSAASTRSQRPLGGACPSRIFGPLD